MARILQRASVITTRRNGLTVPVLGLKLKDTVRFLMANHGYTVTRPESKRRPPMKMYEIALLRYQRSTILRGSFLGEETGLCPSALPTLRLTPGQLHFFRLILLQRPFDSLYRTELSAHAAHISETRRHLAPPFPDPLRVEAE